MFGLREPFERNSWDYDDNEVDDTDLILASQNVESMLHTKIIEPSSSHSESSVKKTVSASRWSSPKSFVRLDKIRQDGVPVATQKQTCWALSIWRQWVSHRLENLIEHHEREFELKEDFAACDQDSLVFWLPKFVAEVRKVSSQPYPPNSLYQICCGLHRSLRVANTTDIDMFNSPKFAQFRDTLDSCMKQLKATGNFAVRKAQPISESIEDLLWSRGLLGRCSPQSVLDTMVFYLGLYFALRSGAWGTPSPRTSPSTTKAI